MKVCLIFEPLPLPPIPSPSLRSPIRKINILLYSILSWKKCNMSQKFEGHKFNMGCKKTHNLKLITNPLKKFVKRSHNKSVGENLTNSKKIKTRIFPSLFILNFFALNKKKNLQGIHNQHQILIPLLNVCNKKSLRSCEHFLQALKPRAHEMSQNTKKTFYLGAL
jgi:hypothetical protein